MSKTLYFFAFTIAPVLCHSQKLENLRANLEGEKIIVTYDAIAHDPADRFNVQLFASHNNYGSPLTLVRGDVGQGVTPGAGKRVEWDARIELGKYKGDIVFEVDAEVVFAPFKVKNQVKSAKRGKTLEVGWEGGGPQTVQVELMRNGVSQGLIGNSTSNRFSWTVPKDQKTGSGYQLQLTKGSKKVETTAFPVTHKIPTLLKAIPIAAVGAVLLLGGKEKPPPDKVAEPPDMGLD